MQRLQIKLSESFETILIIGDHEIDESIKSQEELVCLLVSTLNSKVKEFRRRLPNSLIIIISLAQDILMNCEVPNSSDYKSLSENLKSSNGLIVDCAFLKKIVIDKFYYKRPILVVPYVFDKIKITQLKKPNFPKHIGTNRAFDDVHNNGVVFAAVSKLDEASYGKFYCVKHGDKFESFVNQFFEHFKNGKFEQLPYSDKIEDFLSNISIFVSSSPIDGKAISIIEAMASGKVVIAPRIPCNEEFILEGKSGFLFEVDNVESLKSVLKRCLDMTSSQFSEISEAAKKSAQVHLDSVANVNKIKRFMLQLENLSRT